MKSYSKYSIGKETKRSMDCTDDRHCENKKKSNLEGDNQQGIKYSGDVNELSSRIAHDTRNPLSVIKNSVELMKMAPDLDIRMKSNLGRIERATVRISRQMEELLQYTWPKPLEFADTNLHEILESTMSKIDLQQVKADLPSGEDRIEITCDAAKMEFVFSNLILTSIQSMEGIGSIILRIRDENKSARIEIEDTAPGIPEDMLPKIFDPLSTIRQIGTSLGLMICKNIVEMHGGSIEIKNRAKNGNKIVIYLPKKPSSKFRQGI